MKRSGVVILSTILAVTAILMGVYLAKPSPLVRRVQALEDELKQARHEINRLRMDNEKLRAVSKQAAAEVRSTRRMDAAAAAGAVGEAGDIQRYRLSKMDERMLETSYGPLFVRFGLNEEELAHFKRLLNDRRVTLSDVSMSLTTAGLTPEQITAAAREVAAKRAATNSQFDTAIRHFLNHDGDYQAFQEWEESGTERMHVKYALPVFEAEGDALSQEQQDRLLGLLTSVRKARQPLPRGTSTEVRNQQQDAEKLQILERAAAFLNPHQVQVLKKTSIAVPR